MGKILKWYAIYAVAVYAYRRFAVPQGLPDPLSSLTGTVGPISPFDPIGGILGYPASATSTAEVGAPAIAAPTAAA